MNKLHLSLCVLALGLASAAAAEVNVAVPFLQNGAGGRSKGMGEAYSAVAEGPFAALYNPAALGTVDTISLGFQHESVQDLFNQDVLAGTFQVGPGGASLLYEGINYGVLDQRDTTGQTTGSTLNPKDTLFSLGYGLPLGGGYRAGVDLGFFSEDLGTVRLGGVAVDLGGAWDLSRDGSAAAVLKNVGSKPEGFSLPSSLCLAGAYRLFDRSLLVDVEAEVPLASNTFDIGLGAEYRPWSWLALRMGYKGPFGDSALEGLNFGLGFDFWNFDLDLAFASHGDMNGQGILSLAYTFPKPKPTATPQPSKEENAGLEKKLAEDHFNAGKEYERLGQYIDAIVEYKAALNLQPDYPEAKAAMDEAYQKARGASGEKQVDQSVSVQQAIHKYYEQGVEAYKRKDYSQAIRSLQLVLDLTQHRQATELLEKAKAALNAELATWRDRADRAQQKGDLAGQIEALQKMLALDPGKKNVQAQLNEAQKKVPKAVDQLYKQGLDDYAQGRLHQARNSFEAILRLQPDHAKAKEAVQTIKEKLMSTGQ